MKLQPIVIMYRYSCMFMVFYGKGIDVFILSGGRLSYVRKSL